jgi:hypothetical protein
MRPLRFSVLALLGLAACGDVPGRVTAAAGPSQVVVNPECVYFDVPTYADTSGGAFGDSPGDVIFTENGIPVSIHIFHHPPPDPPSFGFFYVRPALGGFGTGDIGATSNINLRFDFSGLAFVPSTVTFDWRDYGGHENLKVNGSGLFVGELSGAPSPMAGITVASAWGWSAGNVFKQGTTTLTGAVAALVVGGQELFLDNVCANP